MFCSGPKWLIYQECSFIQRSIYVECTVLHICQNLVIGHFGSGFHYTITFFPHLMTVGDFGRWSFSGAETYKQCPTITTLGGCLYFSLFPMLTSTDLYFNRTRTCQKENELKHFPKEEWSFGANSLLNIRLQLLIDISEIISIMIS